MKMSDRSTNGMLNGGLSVAQAEDGGLSAPETEARNGSLSFCVFGYTDATTPTTPMEASMLHPTRILFLVATLALATGCSDGLSEDESRTAMMATAGALSAGGQAGATAAGKADQHDQIEFLHSCTGGGEMKLGGAMVGISISFDVGVKMTKCNRDGVIMDGDLTYTMVAVNAILVKTLQYTYVGTLSFSGSIAGTCDIAMTGSVIETPGLSVATWAGKFCDHEGDKVMAGVSISL